MAPLRRTKSDGVLPDKRALRRANSSKQAMLYYEETAADEVPIAQGMPVIIASVVQDESAAFHLKVGQAVQVKKAGDWITGLASIKKVHADGTYDVSVFHDFATAIGSLREDFVLTNKPYPAEVREATPAVQARLDALANKPPGCFDQYTVDVVCEGKGAHEIWGKVEINAPGFRWAETARRRDASFFELFLSRNSTFAEAIEGAEERNVRALRARIMRATGWQDVGDVYARGHRLDSFHLFRVHGVATRGLALVVLREGQEYDRERWRDLAESQRDDSAGCCVLS